MLSDIQLMTSAGLLVLIWLIQLLHYPSFRFFNAVDFAQAMEFHQSRISFVVIPLMFLELGVTVALAIERPAWPELTALGCVIGIWLSTFLVQVPIHRQLVSRDPILLHRLLTTNWCRTILWSIKFAVVLFSRLAWAIQAQVLHN